VPDIGTCLKLKRKPEKARDNRIRPRSCARPRSRRTACRTAVGRCDEALRAPAVRAFVDVMHESWLFFLNAGKSHFPGGHATTEKVTGLRGAPPRERIARNPHCQIPRRCSQFFLSIAASMSHNIPSIVSTGCAKRRRQGGQKGRWCAKSTGPARAAAAAAHGRARADPMAKPCGAKGSGDSLRFGHEMSNASPTRAGIVGVVLRQGPLSCDGRMNIRMAAPTKNSAPIITLSRALTGRAWNSKPPISPGRSQQTAPASAKTMARIFIAIAAPRLYVPRRLKQSSEKGSCS